MPAYDSTAFRPPAPVASVTVRSPSSGRALSNVLLLIDSGADVSFLPRELGKSFRGQFLLLDAPYGYLGRNILNNISLLLDGPSLNWMEQR